MKLNELILEYYTPEDDVYTQSFIDDTRRPRLTLRHLNRLRKMKELKRLEATDQQAFVRKMYGGGASAEAGGGIEI